MKRSPWVLACVLAALVWSCGREAVEPVADAMVDGAAVLRDAFGSDAAAQMEFDVDCVEGSPFTLEFEQSSSGTPAFRTTSVTTTWTANVSVPGLVPGHATRAFAVLCQHEVFSARYTCPPDSSSLDYTCTGQYLGDQQDQLDCISTTLELADGQARVWCGQHSVTTQQNLAVPSDPPTVTHTGATRHRAHFVIEP